MSDKNSLPDDINNDDLAAAGRLIRALEALERATDYEPADDELVDLACRMHRMRRERQKLLPGRLFAEPAWDMLLALYCEMARGGSIQTSSLGYAADVPSTTALRWVDVLEQAGLIRSSPDKKDKRLRLVTLSERGRQAMDRLLRRYVQRGWAA